jgi:hypothetical protein
LYSHINETPADCQNYPENQAVNQWSKHNTLHRLGWWWWFLIHFHEFCSNWIKKNQWHDNPWERSPNLWIKAQIYMWVVVDDFLAPHISNLRHGLFFILDWIVNPMLNLWRSSQHTQPLHHLGRMWLLSLKWCCAVNLFDLIHRPYLFSSFDSDHDCTEQLFPMMLFFSKKWWIVWAWDQ